MKDIINKLCDDIRELGRDFETARSDGNPIKAECNAANADLCFRLAETIRLSLIDEER